MYQGSRQTRHTKQIVYKNFQFLWIWTHIYLAQKEGISKHFGKEENYAIGLDSCYWFNLEHETEHDIDIAYGVCMH